MARKKKVSSDLDEQESQVVDSGTGSEHGAQEVWRFLSSMKLGLTLLLVIAGLSIIGTLLPTDPNTSLPTYNIYKTFWFQGLLALLCVNLLVCSLNRWKLITRALGQPRIQVAEGFLKNLKTYITIRKKSTLDEMAESLEEALEQRGYRVFTEEREGQTIIAADKGRWGVTGSFITHLSFIVITIGALIGNFTTYEGFVNGLEGQTFSLVKDVQWSTTVKPSLADDFQVRVNKFTMETYPDGSPKGYFSDLTVFEGGQEKLQKTIRVNDPLNYKGVKFYQSSYGSVNKIIFNVLNKKTSSDNTFSMEEQYGMPIPDTNLELRILKFIPDFDPANPEQSRSDQPNNPAVAYALYQGNQSVQQNYQLINTPFEYGDVKITFTNYEPGYYTGLSVRKDPGVPIVWIGCGLMVFGITLSFLMQHRKFWAVVKEANGVAIVELGAVSDKNRLGLEADVEAVTSQLQE
ncbi:MAG TPA: cytochrome c biogenesis protein ResB [Bacillota bacterium]|nr:cytochrome c biogenesis protein ResB [Bacillota bacterium]